MTDRTGLVTLSCPNHHQTLVSGLWNFFRSKHRADLKFQCGGRSIRAHQIVAEIFLQLGKQPGGSDRQQPEPPPVRCPTDSHIEALLEFMYNGCVTVHESLLDNLLRAAKELKFALLVEAVETETAKLCQSPRRSKVNPVPRNLTDQTPNSSVKDEEGQRELPVKRQLRLTKSRVSKTPLTDPELSEDDKPAPADEKARERNIDDVTKVGPARRARGRTKVKPVTRRPRERQMEYTCSQCNYATRLKDRFEVHMARHDPSSTIFSCTFCSQAFLCRETCEQHQSRHTLNRCTLCTFETMKNWQFYQHLFSVHKVNASGEPVEVKVKCPECEFTCKLESQLRHHAREKHSGEKPFTCDQCSYASSRKSVLKRHVRLVHLGIRKEPSCMCEQCGQRCYNQFDLRTHKRSHTDEKPYKCNTCSKSYKYHSAFSRHLRRHTENDKPFVCHVCGFSCSRQDNLRTHIRGVHKTEVEPEIT